MTTNPPAESKTLEELAMEVLPAKLVQDIDLVNIEVDKDEGSKNWKFKKERAATLIAAMIILLLFIAVGSGALAPYLLKSKSLVVSAQNHAENTVPVLITLVASVTAYYFGRENSR